MVKSVKNSAMPTRTILGGFCCRPIAERRKEKEMMYRVKEVIITTMEGSSINRVVIKRICRVCTFSPFTLIHASKGVPPYRLRCSITFRSASRKLMAASGAAGGCSCSCQGAASS